MPHTIAVRIINSFDLFVCTFYNRLIYISSVITCTSGMKRRQPGEGAVENFGIKIYSVVLISIL
jgi:hypothetical protein